MHHFSDSSLQVDDDLFTIKEECPSTESIESDLILMPEPVLVPFASDHSGSSLQNQLVSPTMSEVEESHEGLFSFLDERPLKNDPEKTDRDFYIRESAKNADEIKIQYRRILKGRQDEKELKCSASGFPLSTGEKQRLRSRRESAVTRKRVQAYISELESVCRKLPHVEQELRFAQAEVWRLKKRAVDLEEMLGENIATFVLSGQYKAKSEASLIRDYTS